MKLLKVQLCLFFSLALLGFLNAQEPVLLEGKLDKFNISNQIAFHEDTLRELNVETFLKRKVELTFHQNKHSAFSPGFSNSTFWLRFFVENLSDEPREMMVELSYRHMNRLQFICIKKDSSIIFPLTGDHFPYSQRLVNSRRFAFPFDIEAKEKIECYLFFDKRGESLWTAIYLSDSELFFDTEQKESLWIGICVGILILNILLSFLLYLFFRETLSLWYCLYLFFLALTIFSGYAFGFQYLWPNAPHIQQIAYPFISVWTVIALFIFTLSYINQVVDLKKWKWYIWVVISYIFIVQVVSCFYHLFGPNPWYYLFVRIGGAWIFINFLILGFILFKIYKREKKIEYLLLLAAQCTYYIYTLAYPLASINLITYRDFFQYFPIIGGLLDVFLLAVIMLMKIRRTTIEKNQLENQLIITEKQALNNLLEGQLQERQRLSQNLHDGASLRLANIQMRLSSLHYESDEEISREKIQPILEDLDQTSKDIRNFSHALNPAVLDRYGLVFAFEDLISNIEESHPFLTIQFDYDIFERTELSKPVEQALFYITQELLSNMVKHSKASKAGIILKKGKKEISLIVVDNGIGYEPNKISVGIGLQNIQARVTLLEGDFEIRKREQKGMKHQIIIPL